MRNAKSIKFLITKRSVLKWCGMNSLETIKIIHQKKYYGYQWKSSIFIIRNFFPKIKMIVWSWKLLNLMIMILFISMASSFEDSKSASCNGSTSSSSSLDMVDNVLSSTSYSSSSHSKGLLYEFSELMAHLPLK